MKTNTKTPAYLFLITAILYLVSQISFGFEYKEFAFISNPNFIITTICGLSIRVLFTVLAFLFANKVNNNCISKAALKKVTTVTCIIITICLLTAIFRLFLQILLRILPSSSQIIFNITPVLSYIPSNELFVIFFSLGLITSSDYYTVLIAIDLIFSILHNFLFIIALSLFYFNAQKLTKTQDTDEETSSTSTQKMLNFKQAIGNCFYKYFYFKGPATRSEYWFFILLRSLIEIVILALIYTSVGTWNNTLLKVSFVLLTAYFGVFYLPSVSVAIRRVHDVGFMGIFAYIPIMNFILFLLPSDPKSEYCETLQTTSGLESFGKVLIVLSYIITLIYLIIAFFTVDYLPFSFFY